MAQLIRLWIKGDRESEVFPASGCSTGHRPARYQRLWGGGRIRWI